MKLILAPIRGVTDTGFRTLHAEHFGGFDSAVAPFVELRRGQKVRRRDLESALPGANPALRTVPQLLTDDPEAFVAVARELADGGADEVNWNLGCPYPMVVNHGKGAGLLPHPERIDAFLGRVCGLLPIRISVKVRLGLEDPGELERVMPVLGRYPLCYVAIHGRTAKQMYSGEVDLDAMARCAGLCGVEVVGNGDLRDEDSLHRMQRALPGSSQWMIGRGALQDPFLPARLKSAAGAKGNEVQRVLAFAEAMFAHYEATLQGPGHVLDKMGALWAYLGPSFDPQSARRIKKIAKTRSVVKYKERVARLLEGSPQWRAGLPIGA